MRREWAMKGLGSEFIRTIARIFGQFVACGILLVLCGSPVVATEQVINLEPGRHLFIDDYLVAQADGLEPMGLASIEEGSPKRHGVIARAE